MNKPAQSRTSLGDNSSALTGGAAGIDPSALPQLDQAPADFAVEPAFDAFAFPLDPGPIYIGLEVPSSPETLASAEAALSTELAALVWEGLGDSSQTFDFGLRDSDEGQVRTLTATAAEPDSLDTVAAHQFTDTGPGPNDLGAAHGGLGTAAQPDEPAQSGHNSETPDEHDHGSHSHLLDPELARIPGGIGSTPHGTSATGNDYIDGLLWGGKWESNLGPITYHFVEGSYDGYNGANWTGYEKQAFYDAFSMLESIIDVQFQEVGNVNQANLAPMLLGNAEMGGYLGMHYVPGGQNTATGLFNQDGLGWNNSGLDVGGFGFTTVAHELGHGMGLAHPHDGGGISGVFPGVTSPWDTGAHDLNSGLYTIMSYNDLSESWSPNYGAGFGFQGYMAFDIAALQHIYGANTGHASGNNTYYLPDANAGGTYYQAIWDTGGKDSLVYNGARDIDLDLRAAPLTGSKAGGYLSSADGIFGGYTIANGVTIENAHGGSGADSIIGNSRGNLLDGNGGRDVIQGGGGNDFIYGGGSRDLLYGSSGNDRLFGEAGNDRLVGSSGRDVLNGGQGNDQLIGGSGNDWADYINATGAVTLDFRTNVTTGADGSDTLSGIENARGSNYDDSLFGSNGNNKLNALDGVDLVRGYGGDDKLYGGAGADRVAGDQGKDRVFGGDGNDLLWGGDDADRLYGEAGNDRLYGGRGNDLLVGGSGADIFVFTRKGGSDKIQDFNASEDSFELRGSLRLRSIQDQDVNNDGHTDTLVQLSGGVKVTLLGVSGLDSDDINLI